jgi:phage portal protein BeeE
MSNFLSNFFGNLFSRDNSGFVYRNNYILGRKESVILDTDKPYNIYNSIPQIRQIVDKKATMFSNMNLRLINTATGEVVEDKDLHKLIQNPNIFQSMNKWLRNFKTQEQIYGNQFIYKNKPSNLTKFPISLMNISPAYMTINMTGKVFDQIDINEVISSYTYKDSTSKKEFSTSDIMYTKLDDLDNPVIGKSPLVSLALPISNTKLAYDYRNVIMAEKGAIGILKNRSRDVTGSIPLKPEEKKEIQNSLINEYGIGNGQKRVLITGSDIEWQPMTYPTRDLLLFEEVDANHLTMVDHFGMNINIFSSKNQTYENVKNALIQCYQDTIKPEADEFTQALGKFIGIKEGFHLEADYSHVQILQADKKNEEDLIKSRVASVIELSQAGIINQLQAIQMLKDIDLNIANGGGGVIDIINRLSPLVANNLIQSLTPNELRTVLDSPKVADGDIPIILQQPVQQGNNPQNQI